MAENQGENIFECYANAFGQWADFLSIWNGEKRVFKSVADMDKAAWACADAYDAWFKRLKEVVDESFETCQKFMIGENMESDRLMTACVKLAAAPFEGARQIHHVMRTSLDAFAEEQRTMDVSSVAIQR